MQYNDRLTDEIEAKLKAEIAAFDEQKTLKEIEDNAVGGPDVDAYQEWRDTHKAVYEQAGAGDLSLAESLKRAEPDFLSEDEAVQFNKPTFSKQIVLATLEIKELLSFRESQVWTAVMKNGLSIKETAKRLHIGERTVEEYIARAKGKVIEHFREEGK